MSKQELLSLFFSPKHQLDVALIYLRKALANEDPALDDQGRLLILCAIRNTNAALAGLGDGVGLTYDGGASPQEGSPQGPPTTEMEN